MSNALWEKFDSLTTACYLSMVQPNIDKGVWDEAYDVMLTILNQERIKKTGFAPEISDMENEISGDITGWLEDYLDELEMDGLFDRVQSVCEELLSLFKWQRENPDGLRFRLSSAMLEQGNEEQALSYSEEWYEKQPENAMAAASLIYARMAKEDYEGAEQVVKAVIPEGTACDAENDMVFVAASKLCEKNGNKKEKKRIEAELDRYDEEFGELFEGGFDEDDDDMTFF